MKDDPIIYLVEWQEYEASGILYIGHSFVEAWHKFNIHKRSKHINYDELYLISYKRNEWQESLYWKSALEEIKYCKK